MTHEHWTTFFLSLGLLLGVARLLGEMARRLGQPSVLGEILAGILLGPTVLGAVMPELNAALFPSTGPIPIAIEGLTNLAIALFLLVAGMELDLSTVWRQGRAALTVGLWGIGVPFGVGFLVAWAAPNLLGAEPDANVTVFAIFFATALSISALPVIARILMDLNLYRSDLGMIITAAAILNDLCGWIIFAIVLGLLGTRGAQAMTVGETIVLTVGFAAAMLTLGRWLIHRMLPWIQAHTAWPGGVLGFALSCALLSAAFTEWVGIHAIFGAFLFGVALGDSGHLREKTRATIDQFISFIFAPLFFASIGLRVDFVAGFDLALVLVVLIVATLGKVGGCTVGARLAGLAPREAWAVGFGMNARGAMEIILGLLALQAALIGERMFVALVVMALVTSMTSGGAIQRLLRQRRVVRFTDYVVARRFVPSLRAMDRPGIIRELVQAACDGTELDAGEVGERVWYREQTMSTGLEHGVAVPHARLKGLREPVVAVGLSAPGVDFDALDGQPAHVIVLILTPDGENESQIHILADIARTLRERTAVEAVSRAQSYTQFLALLRTLPAGAERS